MCLKIKFNNNNNKKNNNIDASMNCADTKCYRIRGILFLDYIHVHPKARIKRYRIAICDAIFAVCDVTLIFCRKFCDAIFCKYAIVGYRTQTNRFDLR